MDKKLRRITQMVWHCLTCYPETRNNDRELILQIYGEFYGVYSMPFCTVMDRKDLPSFESIRRCRQKIQAEYPELRAVDEVEDVRLAMQKDYIEYSQEEVAI